MTCLLLTALAGCGAGLYQWQGWQIPYTRAELGGDGVNDEALEALEAIRVKTKRRWRVTSGYRDPEHNTAVGGARHSQHLTGKAFDVQVPRSHRAAFYTAAREAGFVAFGWGNHTVHVDMGPRRWWTYDDDGNHVRGEARYRYLAKAPSNFQRDFRVRPR